MPALKSASGIAVGDEHLAFGGSGGKPLPADGLAGGTVPAFQTFVSPVLIHRRRIENGREINHSPLKTRAPGTRKHVKRGANQEHSHEKLPKPPAG